MEELSDGTLKGRVVLTDFRRRLTLSITKVSEGLEELKKLRRDVIKVTRQPLLGEIEFGQDMPIEYLEFSVRTYNCLKKKDIDTLGQLLDSTESDLLKIRSLGPVALTEIKDRLRELGLELAKEPSDPIDLPVDLPEDELFWKENRFYGV